MLNTHTQTHLSAHIKTNCKTIKKQKLRNLIYVHMYKYVLCTL